MKVSEIDFHKYNEFKALYKSCTDRLFLPEGLINDFVYGYVFEVGLLTKTIQMQNEVKVEINYAILNGSNYVQDLIQSDLKSFAEILDNARKQTELHFKGLNEPIYLRLSNQGSFKQFMEYARTQTIPESDKDRVKLCYTIFVNSLLRIYEDIHFSIPILESLYKLGDPFKKYIDKYWFIVGLNFAKGEIQKMMKEYDDNASEVARQLGNPHYRPYITDSKEDTESGQKNIFKSLHKLSIIMDYCKVNNITVVEDFKSRFNKMKSLE